MYYEVLPLYSLGVRRPRKELEGARRIRADIHIQTDPYGPLGRESLMAHLFSQATPGIRDYLTPQQEQLPPLWDVRMKGMATLAFTLEGVEFVDGQMYQQAWHFKFSDEKFTVPWSLCPRSTLNELI